MIEKIAITDHEQWLALRTKDVTASVVGALLGIHPHTTSFQIAAEKTGKAPPLVLDTGPLKRGTRMEAVVIEEVQAARPDLKIEKCKHYYRDPAARLGATPDTHALCPKRGRGTIQIKTVAEMVFQKKWKVDGEVCLPPWIACQTILEAHLLGAKWAEVGVMVVGFGWDLHMIEVPIHEGLVERMYEEAAAFWKTVDAGEMPDINYGRDAEVLARMFPQDNGQTIDLSGDNHLPVILAERQALKATIKEAEARVDEIDGEVKARMGEAAMGWTPGFAISLKTVNRKEYVAKASSYRALRITTPKEARS
jgi:predicted phage-related endonuclease